MKEALVAEVRRRAEGLLTPTVPISDFHSFTRGKVARLECPCTRLIRSPDLIESVPLWSADRRTRRLNSLGTELASPHEFGHEEDTNTARILQPSVLFF
jgi:hypothetical protein